MEHSELMVFEEDMLKMGVAGGSGHEPSNKAMLKYFFRLSMPMILSNFTGYLILPINSALAGRYEDPKALAAVGLGNVCSFIFIISIITGLNSGQETLTS